MTSQKKVAVVTGASAGIGKAICENLLSEGFKVVGISRTIKESSFYGDFIALQADLGDLESITKLLPTALSKFKKIDVLVNCAGQGQFGSLEEFSFNQMKSLMDINFMAQAYVSRIIIPKMKRFKDGNIIFIGSEAGLTAGRKGAIYSASKFALRGFAQALREECSKSGIRVTIINPGMVKTSFFDTLDFEPGKDDENAITPDEIAKSTLDVIQARPGIVFDEINLTPLKKVINFNPDK